MFQHRRLYHSNLEVFPSWGRVERESSFVTEYKMRNVEPKKKNFKNDFSVYKSVSFTGISVVNNSKNKKSKLDRFATLNFINKDNQQFS